MPRKEYGRIFTQRQSTQRQSRRFQTEAKSTQSKARKEEGKCFAQAEYAKNLVGAGLAPALFYLTERGRTQEKVEEFTQRIWSRVRAKAKHAKGKAGFSREGTEHAKGYAWVSCKGYSRIFTQRQSTQRVICGFLAKAQSTQRVD